MASESTLGVRVDSDRLIEVLTELMHLTWSSDTRRFASAGAYDDEDNDSGRFSELTEESVEAVVAEVNGLRREDAHGLMFYNDFAAEIAVEEQNFRPVRRRGDLSLVDESRGVKYELGRSSPAFTVAAGNLLLDVPRRERSVRPFWFSSSSREEGVEVDPIDALVDGLRLRTLRIVSDQRRTVNEWLSLSESFYFHLAYNLDMALVPRQGLVGRSSPILRLSRSRATDLEAPRRMYLPELVHSYQLALSSESVMLSYLSFYHVAEHWFEEVFLDDVAGRVRAAITAPGFSAKRDKDLHKLIKTVSKSLRARDDEVIINELSGLELTLTKYVDLESLQTSLAELDPSLLVHYAASRVSFADANLVDLRNSDDSAIFKALAQRIYKTRNALVHRKSGERGKFTPFQDDAVLRKEIPLMRFVAEQVIIATSSIP
jgi:hypothetical protein